MGVLSAQSYQPDAFSRQIIELLKTIALQNARLFEETKKQAAELSISYVIGIAISREMTLERVMRTRT